MALLNDTLGNRCSDLTRCEQSWNATDPQRILEHLDGLSAGDTVLILNTNIVFTLPAASELLRQPELVVYAGTLPDKIASTAHIVFSLDYQFETWGDHDPVTGVHSLQQTVMNRLYDTRPAGDLLLQIATAEKLSLKNDDLLEVSMKGKAVLLSVIVTDGIQEGTAGCLVGLGHTAKTLTTAGGVGSNLFVFAGELSEITFRLITAHHLDMVGRTLIAKTVIVGYSCVFCHGRKGDCGGPVGQSYDVAPEDLRKPRIAAMSEAEVAAAMLKGTGHEPVLGYVVPEEYRPFIASYVKTLAGPGL